MSFFEVYFDSPVKVGVYAANLDEAIEKFNAGKIAYKAIEGKPRNITAEIQDDPRRVGGWQ